MRQYRAYLAVLIVMAPVTALADWTRGLDGSGGTCSSVAPGRPCWEDFNGAETLTLLRTEGCGSVNMIQNGTGDINVYECVGPTFATDCIASRLPNEAGTWGDVVLDATTPRAVGLAAFPYFALDVQSGAGDVVVTCEP